MRRFLVTSPNITGEAELVYNEFGILVKIDCTGCKMIAATMQAFKAKIATRVEELEASLIGTTATVVEAEFEATFDMFWKAYPYKRNKYLAESYWPKMNKTDQVTALLAATAYAKYCKKNSWYNPKIADTWLKQREYLNEWSKL